MRPLQKYNQYINDALQEAQNLWLLKRVFIEGGNRQSVSAKVKDDVKLNFKG